MLTAFLDSNKIYSNDEFIYSSSNNNHRRNYQNFERHNNFEKDNYRNYVINALTEARVEVLIPLFAILYAIIILRLLASISLLNGTKRVSIFTSLF